MTRRPLFSAALVLPALLFPAGCDDHVLGVDPNSANSVYDCSLVGVEQFFEEQTCNVCHGATAFSLVDTLHSDLADSDDSNNFLIDTGVPAASRLWLSLTWEDDSIQRMPQLVNEPLPNRQVEHILCWIEDGAPLN